MNMEKGIEIDTPTILLSCHILFFSLVLSLSLQIGVSITILEIAIALSIGERLSNYREKKVFQLALIKEFTVKLGFFNKENDMGKWSGMELIFL